MCSKACEKKRRNCKSFRQGALTYRSALLFVASKMTIINTINTARLTENYANDNRARLDGLLNDEFAIALTRQISGSLGFTNAYMANGQYATISDEQLKAMQPEQRQAFFKQLYQQAAQGVGFFYGRHKLEKTDDAASPSQQVMAWLNHADTLNLIKQVTGHQDIVAASAQITRYTPGHFLTRHNDVNEQEQRRVAYVLNLTPQWHPDWGGLLQFYHQDGTPKDAWTPTFNSLSLFDVQHVHAVTYVAPFAAGPRLAITGWFRATPI